MLTPADSAKNGVRVNGSEITDAVEIRSRDVLQLGEVTLAVTDTAPEPGSQWLIGRDMHEVLQSAIRTYGGIRGAARGTGLHESTIRRWMRTGKGRVRQRRDNNPEGIPTVAIADISDGIPEPVKDD